MLEDNCKTGYISMGYIYVNFPLESHSVTYFTSFESQFIVLCCFKVMESACFECFLGLRGRSSHQIISIRRESSCSRGVKTSTRRGISGALGGRCWTTALLQWKLDGTSNVIFFLLTVDYIWIIAVFSCCFLSLYVLTIIKTFFSNIIKICRK